MTPHEQYIRRCFTLAYKAGKRVKSNPNVGAVLVHNDRIIGEGYHQVYGGPHAEVNALRSVQPDDRLLIPESTLYVSLEPCCIVSKTPACSDLILREKIKKLVVSTTDPHAPMAGRSLIHLAENGIDVTTGILEEEGKRLIAPFVKNLNGLPYITLKWAKSADHYMGQEDKQVWLSNQYSKTAAHKLRAENDAIFIGTRTAILDNPELTTRLYPGPNPLRIVIDKDHRIPMSHHLLADEFPTLALSQKIRNTGHELKKYVAVDFSSIDFLEKLLRALYKKGIHRILIEGGRNTLNAFIKQNMWDEAVIFKTTKILGSGIKAPNLHGVKVNELVLDGDKMLILKNPTT